MIVGRVTALDSEMDLLTKGNEMFDIHDLRSIIMLNYLTDEMLEKLIKITSLVEFRAGEYIYRERQYAEHLYSIVEGKVALEAEKDSSSSFFVEQLDKGRTTGFSALLDTEYRKYLGHAKAMTDVKLFCWRASELEKLLTENYEMGFLLMRRIANIIDRRLQVVKAQLVELHR